MVRQLPKLGASEGAKIADFSAGDEIVYGASRKITDNNYGSYDFHCTVRTTVRVGESATDALQRATGFVEGQLQTKLRELRKKELPYK